MERNDLRGGNRVSGCGGDGFDEQSQVPLTHFGNYGDDGLGERDHVEVVRFGERHLLVPGFQFFV